jgi:hypothetical protein
MLQSRRDLVKLAMSSAVASLLPQAYSQTPTPGQPNTLPVGSRGKFYPDGSVHPFAGNTVISHLPAQCALRDATVVLHDALLAAPYGTKFATLPTDSYHMTVFSGVNDQGRTPTLWPSDIPIDIPIEECTRILNARLSSFKTDSPMPIRMKIDQPGTIQYTGGCSLRLVPADESANRGVRRLRDQLSEVFRFRGTDHSTYEFHITIAYSIGGLTNGEGQAYRKLLTEHAESIESAAPVIELGLPEFCSFSDMYRFNVLSYLRT